MEKISYCKWLGAALLILVAGCAPPKPADTTDPGASIVWLDYALDKSEEKPTGIKQLRSIHEHAVELGEAHQQDPEVAASLQENEGRLKRIPERVFRLSLPARDYEAFSWALGQNPAIDIRFDELIEISKRGTRWETLAVETSPASLSVFMSQAIDTRNIAFFNEHAEDFKASGYALKSPLIKSEFMVRYLTLIGLEGEKAMAENDNNRIQFLIDHTPGFGELDFCMPDTIKRIQALGDYVLYELGNEELTSRLLKLGFKFADLDLEKIDMKSNFAKGLVENPENAVRMIGLDQPGDPLNRTEARFLLQFPVNELKNLHPQRVDEAIEMCLQAGGSDTAKKFIQLKAAQNPLVKEDYVRLMTLGLKYSDNTIYALAKKHGGNISITELDIGELAYNQRVFERYAPKFMDNIENTMEDEPRPDGITLGTIYRIFESKNEKAGLWMVKNYDLEENWREANDDRTLLMDVCAAGNLEAAQYLIEKRKADLQATTRYSGNETSLFGQARPREGKLSAIFFAAKSGNPELIKYLKSEGANINARSNFGATPLMHAVSAEQLEAVRVLIELGAKVNYLMHEKYRNDIHEDGRNYNQLSTAMKRARAVNNKSIIAELEKAGAE